MENLHCTTATLAIISTIITIMKLDFHISKSSSCRRLNFRLSGRKFSNEKFFALEKALCVLGSKLKPSKEVFKWAKGNFRGPSFIEYYFLLVLCRLYRKTTLCFSKLTHCYNVHCFPLVIFLYIPIYYILGDFYIFKLVCEVLHNGYLNAE